MKRKPIIAAVILAVTLFWSASAWADDFEGSDGQAVAFDVPLPVIYFGPANVDYHGFSLSAKMPLSTVGYGSSLAIQLIYGMANPSGLGVDFLAQKSDLAVLGFGQFFLVGGAGYATGETLPSNSDGISAIAGLGFEFGRSPIIDSQAKPSFEVTVEYRPMVTTAPAGDIFPYFVGFHLRRAFFLP